MLHIVASCADRKSASPAVRLRDHSGDLSIRFHEWTRAIRSTRGSRVPADELYQGDYWTVVRSLPAVAHQTGWRPSLWVSSAGYGLVEDKARLVPYSATFRRGNPDSVARPDDKQDVLAEWWRRLTSGKNGLGRSVSSLAEENPEATTLVVASPAYLSAMSADLINAASATRGRGALIIISSGLPRSVGALEACWIPSRAGLAENLGGALVSLHARAARHLLSVIAPSAFRKENLPSMRKKLEQAAGPARERKTGSAMSDDDVLAFIRDRLAVEPKATHTRLLRELRDGGRACEQARFRQLFMQAKS